MEKIEIEALRARVGCAAVLEHEGFAIDLKESTRRAMKFRRDDDIIIVIHEGKGWFDARSDAKGDVFALVEFIAGGGFAEALVYVAALTAYRPASPAWQRPSRRAAISASVAERWEQRKRPWRGSSAWSYLTQSRSIPSIMVRSAIESDLLREGPRGSMWAKHVDADGAVIGWEERGPDWRGFATGGTKELFRFGDACAWRICVTEAAIDAMSLAAIEGTREGTLYVSTGGGWSPSTAAAILALGTRKGSHLVAATDVDPQGEVFARRIRETAVETGSDFSRLKPGRKDWNEELKEREEKGKLPHARQPLQG
ncbi:MAG: DUF3991 and toprim domain-containing protein [Rhizobium sp.]